ncbi:Serine/threonine-protein kinase PknB [Bremerella volcania]|uniref:Serine/threonine-protein kinase PknB n=1 Tax=Bremerella volcania TaxID=2527984 RepID=A0A518C7X6_9BACT|nr:TIGR03067 domain-containing protein [Bremerella volcania]QDU75314.1 Serine/threonine-protein kinase PknB [Bremerella volcania]
MSEKATHPSPDLLHAFGLGQLAPDEATMIEKHISECEPCCETIADLSANDTFIGLLQRADQQPTDQTVDQHSGIAAPGSEGIPAPLAEHPRYEIVGLIGRGGMGDVYKAQHRKMKRTVALKVINRKLFRQGEAVNRFHREVEAAAQLSHPNVVTAHDADQAGDFHFMVMEYVDGVDLSQVVRDRGVLPTEEACEYIRQAALGLQHAYERGMVHRDIKPHNLMVTADGTVKILDFGLASLAPESLSDAEVEEARDELTIAGSIMGTPDFISPEQANNAHAADIRSDIYSLGATFYYLLAGHSPIAGRSVTEKLRNLAENEPESLTMIREDIPADVTAVVEKMLAKNPEERFQTPAEVAEALLPFIDGGNSSTGKPSATRTKSLRNFAIAAGLLGLIASIGVAMMMRESVGDKLAKMDPGVTSVSYPPAGKEYLFLYTVEGAALDGEPAAVCDIGDCRIALLGQDISATRDYSVGVNVAVADSLPESSTRERDSDGKVFFTSNSADGKATCKFHGFKFDLTESMISIGNSWSHKWKDPSSPGLLILVDTKTNRFTTQAMRPRSEREPLPERWIAPPPSEPEPRPGSAEGGLHLSPQLQAGLRQSGQSVTDFQDRLKATLSHAAGIPNDQWEKTGKGMGTDAIQGMPLSKLLIMTAPVDRSNSGDVPAPRAFRMLTSRVPKPLELHKAMSPSQVHGYVSVIQPEYVLKITLDVDPETKRYKGTVWFEAPDLYAGKVDFALKYDAGRMDVVEFILPEQGTKLVRTPNGLWTRSGSETEASANSSKSHEHDRKQPAHLVSDLDRIQGTWQVTYSEDSGRIAPQELLANLRFIIDGQTLTTEIAGRKSVSTYKLDPTSTPKMIDLTENGRSKLGIYDLDGDTLRICIAETGKQRPAAFDSQPNSANDVVIMLKRIHPAVAAAPLATDVPRVTDLDRIQGNWGVTSQLVDGEAIDRNWEKDVIYYMVSGYEVDLIGGSEIDHAKFRLDATKSPKTIDIRHEDGTVERGIYEVEGESLVICSAKPGAKDRPTSLESKKGSGTTLTRFELLDPPLQLDSQRIQKTWQLISSIADGVKVEQDEPLYFIFDEDSLVIDAGTEKERRSYRLVDSDDGPQKINLIFFDGDVTRCIYEIEGDTMRLCIQDMETDERPTSFESTSESKTTLMTFREVPPEYSDHQLIQGTWQLTEKMNHEGLVEASKWKTNPTTYVFQGNKLIRNDGTEKLDTDFYLDYPWGQIMLIDEEWNLTRGGYEIEGDTLQISLSDDEYLPSSPLDKTPTSNTTLLFFKRVNQADKSHEPIQKESQPKRAPLTPLPDMAAEDLEDFSVETGKSVPEVSNLIRQYYIDKYPLFAAVVNKNSHILRTPADFLQKRTRSEIGDLAVDSPVSELINSLSSRPAVTFSEATLLSQDEALVTRVNIYQTFDKTCRVVVSRHRRRYMKPEETYPPTKPITQDELRRLLAGESPQESSTLDEESNVSTKEPHPSPAQEEVDAEALKAQ